MPYFFYPRIYKVTDVGQSETYGFVEDENSQFLIKPNCYPAGMEKLGSKDAYLIDNGEYLYLYIGN